VFAEALRQFRVVATEDLGNDPELRRLILSVTRAAFEMSSKYRYTAEDPWMCPSRARRVFTTATCRPQR
jgi:surfactin synthase thioesterase subunit